MSESSSRLPGLRPAAGAWAWLGAVLALLCGLAITAAVVRAQHAGAVSESQVRFKQHVDRLQAAISQRFNRPVYGLQGARGVYAATGHEVNRAAFRAYVQSRDLPVEFPGVRGFGYAQRVLRADVEAFVAAERADQAPDFAVRTEGNAADLFIVKYIEPLAQNYPGWGYDIGSEAVRREAIERAMDTGLPALSGQIIINRDNHKHPGFLYLVPLFRDGTDPANPEQRRAAMVGLLYAPIIASEVLAGAAHEEGDAVRFRLAADGAGGRPSTVFDSGVPAAAEGAAGGFWGAAEPAFGEVRRFTLGGQWLTLSVSSTPAFDSRVDRSTSWWLGAGGLMISLMLAVTVWVLAASRARAVALARAMTQDLDRLAKVAQRTSNAVVITDAQRRITWVNEGFTRISGYSEAEALGRVPGQLLQSELTDAATVQHMREALADGTGCRVELRNRSKDGRDYWVDLEIQPLRDARGGLTGFMAIESDITARKTLQAEVAEAARQLRDLYDHAPCGYYSLDATGRFVAINQLALHWLGCTREEALGRMGSKDFMTAEGQAQFLEHFPRIRDGGRVDGLELDLCSRDGTVRRISLSATAVLDEAGRFVRSRTAIFDITETHRIRQQLHHLNLQQETMLDSDLVGMVKLRDRTIVWKNGATARLFGYAPGELIGQSTRRLYPQDADYEALGSAAYPVLHSGRQFRTQLQVRRKSGELIWVDLSGVRLPTAPGEPEESLWMMIDISQIKAYQTQIERAAFHDALTGLPNRLLLSDRLRQALAVAARERHEVAVCYLDLDGFKRVNDTHGHDAGDEVLKAVAQRLLTGVRPSDTVSRLGGDEFVVLLAPSQNQDECLAVLQRLLAEIVRPITLDSGAVVGVGSSIGAARYPGDGTTAEALMLKADHAMYASKRAGPCGIRFDDGRHAAGTPAPADAARAT